MLEFGQVIYGIPGSIRGRKPPAIPGPRQVHAILSCTIQHPLSSFYSLANLKRVHLSSLQSPSGAELSFQTVEKPAAINSLHGRRRQTQSSANTNAMREKQKIRYTELEKIIVA